MAVTVAVGDMVTLMKLLIAIAAANHLDSKPRRVAGQSGLRPRRAGLHPVGAQPAALTAQEHLALAPLALEVRLVVEQVMLEEQGSKRHGTVNLQDEVHSFGLAQRTRHVLDDTLGIAPVTTHRYDKHGNYVPEGRNCARSP